MNIVIYARFSSHAQREESIEGQIRKCKAYAEQHGMTVVGEYIDRAMTGRNDKRKDFQRLMRDSEKGTFQGVIMYTLDRFARNRYDSAMYKAKLKKNGVKVFYAEQSIPEGPEGIILESVLEGYAEYYSENLSRNVKRGMMENAYQCKINGGQVPFGYQKSADGHYEINESTAPIVRRIFEMYADGMSVKKIVDLLNIEGYKTSRGQRFTINGLHGILYNRKYRGEYAFADVVVEDGIPAIIEKALFDRVQEMLHKNKRMPGKMLAPEPYLLTTKLFCGHCGAAMVGESGTSANGTIHNYYKCQTRKKEHSCDKHQEKKDLIERFVVEQTVQRLLAPNMISDIAQKMADIMRKEYEDDTRLEQLQDELSETQRAIKNLIRLVEKGLDTDDVGQRLMALTEEKQELEKHIAIEKHRVPPVSAEKLEYWLRDLLTGGSVDDKEYQRRIIDTLVNSIHVYDADDGGRVFVFVFNITKNNTHTVRLDDLKSSDAFCQGRPNKNLVVDRNYKVLIFYFGYKKV